MEELFCLIGIGILAIIIWPLLKMVVGFIMLVIYQIFLTIGALATLALLGLTICFFLYCLYQFVLCFSDELNISK